MTDRPLVLPQLHYEDPNAAVEWLCRVFGFHEESRLARADGVIHVADLRGPDGGAILVSGLSDHLRERMRSRFPEHFREAAASWPNLTYSITVLVTDVDAHFERAARLGARTVTAPRDQPWGLRDYEVLDLGGRQWNFSQHLRDTAPSDWGAT